MGDALNLTCSELGSFESRGRIVVVMAVPFARAVGGINVRNRRAGFAQAENGLNLAVTSVMNLVIISTTWEAQRACDQWDSRGGGGVNQSSFSDCSNRRLLRDAEISVLRM